MAETKRFHLGDLVSVNSGVLVSPNHIGGVYDVVDFVTGQAHMTHQLPRASETVRPWLVQQHPWLTDVVIDFTIPDGASRDEAWLIVSTWLEKATAQWGDYHEVESMPFGMYVGREPIAELREMAPHAQIIGVEVPADTETKDGDGG